MTLELPMNKDDHYEIIPFHHFGPITCQFGELHDSGGKERNTK